MPATDDGNVHESANVSPLCEKGRVCIVPQNGFEEPIEYLRAILGTF